MSVIQPIYPRIQLHFLTCQIERLIYKIRQTFLYKPWAHTTSEKDLMKYIRALWFKPWPRTLNTHRITPYHGSQWFCPCFRGWFWPILYFLCQTSTWHLDSCPPEDTWCGVILWVLRVLGQGFNQSSSEFSLAVTPLWRAPKRAKQPSMRTIQLCFEFFRHVVLMSCKVNVHVVRSALQYSACRV